MPETKTNNDSESRTLITLEELVKHLATKEELQKLRVELILWLIGTNIAVGSAVVWFILNFALVDVKSDVSEIRNDLREIRNRLPAATK
jgi:hypothetical protein